MNNNIFSPNGKIDGVHFAINYIILFGIYILCGLGGFLFLAGKNQAGFIIAATILLIIKILVTFNYKKRILDICENLPISIILAIIIGFDAELFLPFLGQLGNAKTAVPIFYASMVLLFIIPPLITAIIPAKKKN